MNNYLNQEVIVRADGVNIQGKLISDTNDKIIIESNKKYTIIFKSKISMLVVSGIEKNIEKKDNVAQDEEIPLTMLACQNKGIKCVGVRCIVNKLKSEIVDKDYEAFMNPCSKKCETCRNGIIGNVYDIDSKILVYTLKDVIFGDYPE